MIGGFPNVQQQVPLDGTGWFWFGASIHDTMDDNDNVDDKRMTLARGQPSGVVLLWDCVGNGGRFKKRFAIARPSVGDVAPIHMLVIDNPHMGGIQPGPTFVVLEPMGIEGDIV